MTHWTNKPPEATAVAPYRLVRVSHIRPLRAIIISEQLIGVMLHYWKGRSRPCQQENCEACKSGQKPRWKGYFQIQNLENRTVYIAEITERVWHEFNAEAKKNGTLRGAKVELSRTNKRNNAPLAARFMAGRVAESDLPPQTDVGEILMRMWEVTQTEMFEEAGDNDDHERGILTMEA